MTKELWEYREEWAETEAKFYDRVAEDHKKFSVEYAANADYRMALKTQTISETYANVARQLRQPKNIRLENEEYARLQTTTR